LHSSRDDGYLEEALKEYIGNGGWYDDVTILIVKKVS
jgi:serine phosphatase RsbU (regulator of sigma subunit)